MPSMNGSPKNINELTAAIAGGETKASAVVERSLKAAEDLNVALNAFLEIQRAGALARAGDIDGKLSPNPALASELPLAGIPIAIKDNICVEGMQASCGSRILGDY